jgi:hypothetical protein
MTDIEVIAALDDLATLALTAWAEARRIPRDDDSHSPIEELVAVMVVVRNRRPHFASFRAADDSYKSICLAPNQFSCWNPGTDANHLALLKMAHTLVDQSVIAVFSDPLLDECLFLADGVIGGVLMDRTNGATMYYAPAAMIPVGRVPASAMGKTTLKIGDQFFYG